MSTCRFCSSQLKSTFVDLGVSPLANSYVPFNEDRFAEKFYPLHAYVCDKCLLVQLDEFESPTHIFEDYAYLSSFSESWLAHCRQYVDHVTQRFHLNEKSLVIEIASNDGYLLQYFKSKNINVLGIEPAKNIAAIAQNEKDIHTLSEFFSLDLATSLTKKGMKADLLIGNNVLAHVPNINDFIAGVKTILADDGVITMEFPHLLNLIKLNQFDTIYHEHFSYLSLFFVQKLFTRHDLTIFDVDMLPTHGGSIRIYATHASTPPPLSPIQK